MVKFALPLPNRPAPLRVQAQDGLALAAEHWPGRGASVVLAHGFGQTRQSWQRTAECLSEHGYDALGFDARGHGESERNAPDQRYQPSQLIGDLQAVAAQANAPRVLVGASMGGLVGLLAQAASRPFAAMVLVDITPRWEASGFQRILGFMRAHPDGFADHDEAADAISAHLPHRSGRKSPEQLASLLVMRADGRLLWHWDPRLLDDLPAQSEPLQDLLVEVMPQIRVPLLLVSGGRSDLVSDHTVREFLTLAPHAAHIAIPKATHMVAGDDNTAFTAAILRFLDSPAVRTALTGGHP